MTANITTLGIVAWIAMTAVGIGLFYVQRYLPRLYGALEFIVGSAALFLAFNAETNNITTDTLPDWTNTLSKFLVASAGLYIIVRGVRNFHEAKRRT
jgi:hypothetical protein